MNKSTSLFAISAVLITLLAACGGGGDASAPSTTLTPAPASVVAPAVALADKYVGSWGLCIPEANPVKRAKSWRAEIIFTKTSATTLDLTRKKAYFLLADCAGVVDSYGDNQDIVFETFTLDGTKVIDNNTVDLIMWQFDFGPSIAVPGVVRAQRRKALGLVTATTLTIGESLPKDDQGYPTVLDTTNAYKKL